MIFLLASLFLQQSDLRVPLESHAALAIGKVEVPTDIKRYQTVDFAVEFKATYSNAFHQAQADLVGTFSGPKETKIPIHGFFYQGYSRKVVGGKEALEKTGEPGWIVRFSAPHAGKWSVRFVGLDRMNKVESQSYKFEVADSKDKGYVGPAKDRNYFRYDDGTPYFGVGLNLAWDGDKGLDDYEEWFSKLAANGGNLARSWSFPGGFGLEWSDREDGTWRRGAYSGLGKYSLDNAWLLDQVFRLAEKYGIKIILCLGTYGELKTDKGMWNEGVWASNPYNAALGGPCASPNEIFTDAKARAFYRRRLNYLAARYAASPALLSWELWNEVDAPDYWVHEMAQELAVADPYGHFVTTSYGTEAIWRDDYVNMATAHIYGDGKTADLAERIAKMTSDPKKPKMVTECGIDFAKPDGEHDPTRMGISLKTGLWQAAATSCAAGAMNWWWDSYVAKYDLWKLYKPFADAVARVDWLKSPMKTAEITEMQGNVAASGVIGDHAGLFWLRQQGYNWKDWKGTEPPTLPMALEIHEVKDGKWSVTWWDTAKGKEISQEEVSSNRGTLFLKVPSFSSDIALLLSRK